MPTAFFDAHCFDCHDVDEKKGGLDLTALKPDFADAENFARWVKVHDLIESSEMPPKKKERPPAAEKTATMKWLRESLIAAEQKKLAGEGAHGHPAAHARGNGGPHRRN
ncbi:MAG: c-type cytochrome domain-containing protein [Chthoniobacteraceae bacterium]